MNMKFSYVLVNYIILFTVTIFAQRQISTWNYEDLISKHSDIISLVNEQIEDTNFDVTTIYKIPDLKTAKEQNPNGYFYENFSSVFDGSYVIEVHSKTNAIGKLIDTKGLSYISNFNFKPYVEDNKESFQNISFMNIIYDKKNWKEIRTTETGKYCDRERRPKFLDFSGTCDNTIDAANGIIKSPLYPNVYPISKTCVWDITAPTYQKIVLNFTDFEIEGSDDCRYDAVEVYSKTKSNILEKHGVFCGSEAPPIIISSGNSFRIVFKADDARSKKGFSAVFYTENSFDENQTNGCLNTLVYYDDHSYYSDQKIFEMEWKQQNFQDYLSITLIYKENGIFSVYMKSFNNIGREINYSELKPTKNLKTLLFANKFNLNDKVHRIEFYKKCINNNEKCSFESPNAYFGIRQIKYYNHVQPNSIEGDEKILITDPKKDVIKVPVPFNISNADVISYTEISKLPKHNCLNGGFKRTLNSSCVCPPGFQGKLCEKGCGINSYGADCSGVCSFYSKGCQGMMMCTTSYGCTCPPGFTGNFCDEDCPNRTYGANCQQSCPSKCYNGTCDQYTGLCTQGCESLDYTPPYCDEEPVYLLNPPKLISADFESLTVELNFSSSNINKNNGDANVIFYQLYQKNSSNEGFPLSEIKYLELNKITETITNLNPDTEYDIGAMLITADGHYKKDSIIYGHYRTFCTKPNIANYNMTLISLDKGINVTWTKISTTPHECKIKEYHISVSDNQNKMKNNFETIYFASSSESYYVIPNLMTDYEYSVQFTPITSIGALTTSPVYKAKPVLSNEYYKIRDIIAKVDEKMLQINVSWTNEIKDRKDAKVQNASLNYIIRYKINKYLSCSISEVTNLNWSEVDTVNVTNYNIFNITPNTQYSIQVLLFKNENINTDSRENIVHVLAPPSTPMSKPELDEKTRLKTTKNSVFVQWKYDQKKNCKNLNGFFAKFFVQLTEKYSGTTITAETFNHNITFDGLQTSTNYELKVFVKNSVGYNPNYYLYFNITTKSEFLKHVEELQLYKKSLTKQMAGLRWKYRENADFDGFIASFYNDTSIAKNYTFDSKKCVAWPDYYCQTLLGLPVQNRNNSYKIELRVKSSDYPTGGEPTSITYNNIEGVPDSPTNVKALSVGKNNITIQWGIPWMFNSDIESFIVKNTDVSSVVDGLKTIEGQDLSSVNYTLLFTEEMPTYNYTLQDLKPDSTYFIGVLSKSFWHSAPSTIMVKTLS